MQVMVAAAHAASVLLTHPGERGAAELWDRMVTEAAALQHPGEAQVSIRASRNCHEPSVIPSSTPRQRCVPNRRCRPETAPRTAGKPQERKELINIL